MSSKRGRSGSRRERREDYSDLLSGGFVFPPKTHRFHMLKVGC